jgi:hypothetical protein
VNESRKIALLCNQQNCRERIARDGVTLRVCAKENAIYLCARLSFVGMKMINIVAAETQMHYQDITQLLDEFISTDATQLSQLGLDPQAAFDFFFYFGHV